MSPLDMTANESMKFYLYPKTELVEYYTNRISEQNEFDSGFDLVYSLYSFMSKYSSFYEKRLSIDC